MNEPEPPTAPADAELPLEGGHIAAANVIRFVAGVFPQGSFKQPVAGECSHLTYQLDDRLERAVCGECGQPLPLYRLLKQITRQDIERGQQIAYLERLKKDQRDREKAIRSNRAAQGRKKRQEAEAAALEAAHNPVVPPEAAKPLFGSLKAAVQSGEAKLQNATRE